MLGERDATDLNMARIKNEPVEGAVEVDANAVYASAGHQASPSLQCVGWAAGAARQECRKGVASLCSQSTLAWLGTADAVCANNTTDAGRRHR